MVFSSMTFLFAFLPVVVLVYMLSPKQMKNAILLIASLFFYAWGEPRNILLMLLSIGINYVFGRIIEADRASQSKMRVWNLGFAVLWNVLILGIFKYVSGISQTLHTMLPSLIPVVKIALPIGISFYTFQTMSYTIDVYRGEAKVQKNFITFGAYVALFPQLIAGPIVRYQTVAEQMDSRKETLDLFKQGVLRFAKCVQTQILHTKIYSSFLILASYHIISYNIRQHFFNFVASHTKFRIYFYSYISPLSTEYMYALFLDFSFLGDTPIYILLLHTCMPSISISSDISQYTL